MSVLTLAEVKEYLRVSHTLDDSLLADLIEDAEDECLQYIDRPSLPRVGAADYDEFDTSYIDYPVSDSSDLPRSLRRGILLIIQGAYEGKDADEMAKIRMLAEIIWHPYRQQLGA